MFCVPFLNCKISEQVVGKTANYLHLQYILYHPCFGQGQIHLDLMSTLCRCFPKARTEAMNSPMGSPEHPSRVSQLTAGKVAVQSHCLRGWWLSGAMQLITALPEEPPLHHE
jgi:hypothetical protein